MIRASTAEAGTQQSYSERRLTMPGVGTLINLIWDKEIRVPNMLPMVLIGVALSYVPLF